MITHEIIVCKESPIITVGPRSMAADRTSIGKWELAKYLKDRGFQLGDYVVYQSVDKITRQNLYKILYIEEMHHLVHDFDYQNNPQCYTLRGAFGSPFKSSLMSFKRIDVRDLPPELVDELK